MQSRAREAACGPRKAELPKIWLGGKNKQDGRQKRAFHRQVCGRLKVNVDLSLR